MNFRNIISIVGLIFLRSILPTVSLAEVEIEKQLGERWENLGLLYKDKDNKNIQELWILGRYHGQYYWADGSVADNDDFETRRSRMGAQARLFEKMTLHAQMVSGSDYNPFYNGFTELWAQWAFMPELALTVGQQKHRFTHDRNVSSRYINYLERSMLTNMFKPDYTPAVTLQGKIENASYYSGFFSNATDKDMEKSFTELDSGYSFLSALYYDLKSSFGTESAYIHTSYVYSDANENATNLNTFNNGISSALILTEGSGSLVSEVTAGLGGKEGNAFALNFQPGYFLTNKIQIVGRYQIALSSSDQGLIPQRRYERETELPNGDLYQSGYFGLNYYIAKHRLKLMSGLEYSKMSGEDVWTTSVMLRLFFGPHSGGAFPMNQMRPGHFFEFD